jgi:hypothetical protein
VSLKVFIAITTRASGPDRSAPRSIHGHTRRFSINIPANFSAIRMIIELNIKHYGNLLKTETDASKRQTVSQLLSKEEAKLAKLLTQEDKDK